MILADLLNKAQPHVIGWIYNMISTGWIRDDGTWSYVNSTSMQRLGGAASQYPKGVKIRLVQGGQTKYFYGIGASGSDVILTLTGGSDYTLANAEISDVYISYAACPQGFPQWFGCIPQFTASIVNPSIGNGELIGKFCITGRLCVFNWRVIAGSTTSAGEGNYTISVPVPAADTTSSIGSWWGNDQGVSNFSGVTRFVNPAVFYLVGDVAYGNYVTHAQPFAFANGDSYRGTVMYPV